MDLDYIKRLLNEIDAINFPYCCDMKHRLLGCVQTYDVVVAEILRMREPEPLIFTNYEIDRLGHILHLHPNPFFLYLSTMCSLCFTPSFLSFFLSGTTHPLKVGMSKDVLSFLIAPIVRT